VRGLSQDEDKHKTVNKRCAAMIREKVMAKTFRIALVPVPVGAKPGDGGLTAKRRHARD
jgi:hypothetical protein